MRWVNTYGNNDKFFLSYNFKEVKNIIFFIKKFNKYNIFTVLLNIIIVLLRKDLVFSLCTLTHISFHYVMHSCSDVFSLWYAVFGDRINQFIYVLLLLLPSDNYDWWEEDWCDQCCMAITNMTIELLLNLALSEHATSHHALR